MTGAILAIVLGAALAPLFVVGFVRNVVPLVWVSRYGASAAGTIVGFTQRRLQYRTVDRLVVRFTTADGRSIEFTDPMARRAGLQRGDSVTVHYSPQRPKGTATIADTGRAVKVATVAGVLTIMMTGMLVFGVLIVVGGIPAGHGR